MFNFLFLSKLIILIESLGSKDANYKIFISFVFTLRSSFVPTPPSLINNLNLTNSWAERNEGELWFFQPLNVGVSCTPFSADRRIRPTLKTK